MIKKLLWNIWSLLPAVIKAKINVRRRSPYWQKAGVIFIHVPKAAGTSVSYSVYGRSLGHIKTSDILKYGTKEIRALYKFSFVRNPWDRAVSAYHFAKSGGTLDAGMKNSKEYKDEAFSSFESFVREWLVKQELTALDPVFRTQSEYLYDNKGQLLVDYLGRVESIAEDVDNLSKIIDFQGGLKVMNQSRRGDYRDYYSSDELVTIVGEIYKEDINNFGYKFDK